MPAPSVYSRQGLNLERLGPAFLRDRKALEPFREKRAEIGRQIAGRHYGDSGCPEELLVNLLYQYATIVSRTLIPHHPRCLWTTPEQEHVPLVDGVMQYVNEEAARQRLGEEAGRVVTDALMSAGFMYVALTTPADAASAGYTTKVGKPKACRVSLDDMVFDTYARDFHHLEYIGHRFYPYLDAIRDDSAFSKARKDLKATDWPHQNDDGDQRLFKLVTGMEMGGHESEFEERCELWSVYFPRYKKVCILSDDQIKGLGKEDEPLMVKEWLGPDCGPYHALGMFWVTDLLMPLAPMQQLLPLHVLVNNLYRKLADQAERNKVVTVHDGSAAEDAEKITRAMDGDTIQVANLDRVKQMVYGGADPNNALFVENARAMFNVLAGNLELMAGAGQQASTATQEKLLNMNSSRSIQDMQMRVNSWMEGIFDSLGWFYHNHPQETMRVIKAPRGAPDAAFERVIHPHPRFSGVDPRSALARHIPYDRIVRKLDPYSMQYTGPQERAGKLREMWMNMLMPILPLLQQQGTQPDIGQLLRILADYEDMPELLRIVQTVEPPSEDMAAAKGHGESHERTLPPNTSRTYERTNRTEQTPGGQRTFMRNALMGVNPGGNPQQTGGLNGRPAGVY